MNLLEWQALSGAYWPSRKDRLIYAIRHDEGFNPYPQLPMMQWIRTIELMGVVMGRSVKAQPVS